MQGDVEAGMTSDRWITFWSKDGAEVRTGLLQHVRDDWETGWRITARVNRRLSETAGLRVMGTSGQIVAMLLELEAEGAVEKRKGPMGFMEWRRAQ